MSIRTLEELRLEGIHYQELHYKIAHYFLDHLKKILAQNSCDTISLSKRELYKGMVYPESFLEAIHWHDMNEMSKAHEYAAELGLIYMDTFTRPYRYSIKEQQVVLRPYQHQIAWTVKYYDRSVLIEAPTGAGKSVIASEIAKNEIEKGGKVLIVAPKIILLEQLSASFQALQPQIIHGPKDYDTSHSVFISTLQTAHKRKLGFEPTMVMIDEVHFGFSGKMIKTLLEDFKGRLIGLSATPYDQNSKPIEGFDKHIDEFDLNYMFRYEYLVQPICYAPVKIDLSSISIQVGDYNQAELDSSFNNFENISQIVENTKDMIAKQKAALIFCINISHAKAVASAFNEAGINTKAIHSQLSKQEQDAIMQEYKSGKVKMLANPMMLTTGFDDPATDCIVLARATKSQNLYRQMVGRGLRLYEGKTHASIIDCAGVIDNLGLPTQPQEPNALPLSKRETQCPSCESTRIYRVNDQYHGFIRKCADCGHFEAIEEQGCECDFCGAIHGSKAKYFSKDEGLFLDCSVCGNHTLIASKSSAQELKEIFSEKQIKALQEKFTIAYIKHLNTKAAVSLPFREDVSRHILAFQNYIAENIVDFMSIKFKDLMSYSYRPFYHSKQNDPESHKGDRWFHTWSWETQGRLFGLELEAKLLGTDVNNIKKTLETIQDPHEAIELVNKLLHAKGEPILEMEDKEHFFEQLKETSLANINQMCAKRLKDIYLNNEPIEEILRFIPMLESVLKDYTIK